MWICPLCRQELISQHLQAQVATFVCASGHSFDIAREGYVNLLQVNRKHSQQPGDSKEMIAARRRVHDAGLYQPLAVAMQERLCGLEHAPARVLDLGCGEGFYSAALMHAFPTAQVYGVDIAKPAVRLAAKKWPQALFAVASAFDVPLPDESMDAVVSIFAPASPDEVRRLLPHGGYYLKVTPAPQHLWELRTLLYEHASPHRVESQLVCGFEPVMNAECEYLLEVSGDDLRDLVAMTPYAHKGQRAGHEAVAQLESLRLQMCFSLSLQRKL